MPIISELIVDAYGCRADLSDAVLMEGAARRALESVGATVVETASHRFQPHGLTLVMILKESHFIVSTWPEFETAIVNIFLCNDSMDAEQVWREFSKILQPTRTTFHSIKHQLHSVEKEKSA